MSPEVIFKIKTTKSDIWSFGATIIEMVNINKTIYFRKNRLELIF